MEIIINKKIMADDYELDNTITRKQVDLDSMKGELFTIIFTNIYLSRYVEKKVLGTLTPREIIDFFDVFEE